MEGLIVEKLSSGLDVEIQDRRKIISEFVM
jgi:hypothetical protein